MSIASNSLACGSVDYREGTSLTPSLPNSSRRGTSGDNDLASCVLQSGVTGPLSVLPSLAPSNFRLEWLAPCVFKIYSRLYPDISICCKRYRICRCDGINPAVDEGRTEYDNFAEFARRNTDGRARCPIPVGLIEQEQLLVTQTVPGKRISIAFNAKSRSQTGLIVSLCADWLRSYHRQMPVRPQNLELNVPYVASCYANRTLEVLQSLPLSTALQDVVLQAELFVYEQSSVRHMLPVRIHGDFGAANISSYRDTITVFDVPEFRVSSPFLDIACFALSSELSSSVRFRRGPDGFEIANLLWRHYRGGLTDSGLEDDPEYLVFHALGLLRLTSLHFTKAASLANVMRVPVFFHLNALYVERFRKLFAAVEHRTGRLSQPSVYVQPLVSGETASLPSG